MSEKKSLNCSFCGKNEVNVKLIIAGPDNVNICEVCVSICVSVMADNYRTSISVPHPLTGEKIDKV